MPNKLQNWAQTTLGYRFAQPFLLTQALTHPSFSPEANDAHYERLEFLGDAVLELLISEALYARYPEEKEGHLAKRRAALVCREHLAQVARELQLGEVIRLGQSEESADGHENDATLENAVEALIAALYLDAGLEKARELVMPWFTGAMNEMAEPPRDPKTQLQEWAQGIGLPLPVYETMKREGPSHAPAFTVRVTVDGQWAEATGTNKKAAQRDAAAKLIETLGC